MEGWRHPCSNHRLRLTNSKCPTLYFFEIIIYLIQNGHTNYILYNKSLQNPFSQILAIFPVLQRWLRDFVTMIPELRRLLLVWRRYKVRNANNLLKAQLKRHLNQILPTWPVGRFSGGSISRWHWIDTLSRGLLGHTLTFPWVAKLCLQNPILDTLGLVSDGPLNITVVNYT